MPLPRDRGDFPGCGMDTTVENTCWSWTIKPDGPLVQSSAAAPEAGMAQYPPRPVMLELWGYRHFLIFGVK